jgi:hypothetical protein
MTLWRTTGLRILVCVLSAQSHCGPAALAGESPAPSDPLSSLETAIAASKQPFEWLGWGADLRFRQEYIEDAFMGTQPDVYNQLLTRIRLWTSLQPVDLLEVNARLAWEGRYFASPDEPVPVPVPAPIFTDPIQVNAFEPDEILVDQLNFRLTNLWDVPLAIAVGRQDLFLGQGWLVGEGTPLDGARTHFFDALRADYHVEALQGTFTAIYIDQGAESDRWLPPINAQDHRLYLSEQDERGVVLQFSNRTLPNALLEAAFLYKHDEAVLENGATGDLYAISARAEIELKEHWVVRAEVAPEFGWKNGATFEALGSCNQVAYRFHDRAHQEVHVGYEYLSGENGSTIENDRFDPFWGRWPQWSELLYYNPTFGNTRIEAISPRMADWGNYHRLNLGWRAEPTHRLGLAVDYHALWAAQDELRQPGEPAPYSEISDFRGHLATGQIQYTFGRHLRGHVRGEVFWPGGYYEYFPFLEYRPSHEYFLRTELEFRW